MALLTHFATLAAVTEYLISQCFDPISNTQWISADGLINAEIIGGHSCYVVDYFA